PPAELRRVRRRRRRPDRHRVVRRDERTVLRDQVAKLLTAAAELLDRERGAIGERVEDAATRDRVDLLRDRSRLVLARVNEILVQLVAARGCLFGGFHAGLQLSE